MVHAELLADVLALHHQELRVELLLQFALPLKGEVGRADDQDALGEPPKLQLANEKAGHDRLARAGVVGEQEPHPRELKQVVVDRLELMRQRIDARDREAEIRIKLVGDAQSIGLKAEAEQSAVAVEGVPRVENREALQILGGHRHLAKALGVCAHEAHDPARRAVGCTVSTRIGSLKSGPTRIWPRLIAASSVMWRPPFITPRGPVHSVTVTPRPCASRR